MPPTPSLGSYDLRPRRRTSAAKPDQRLSSPATNECDIRNVAGPRTSEGANLPLRLCALAIAIASAFAFSVGTITRLVTFPTTRFYYALPADEENQHVMLHDLPSPKAMEGKDVPFTTFATKTFGRKGAKTSHTVHLDRWDSSTRPRHDGEAADGSEAEEGDEKKGDLVDDEDDELHLPAGQHLLVDIRNVDHDFLSSEARLARAMIELVDMSQLTLLSYHCHSLVPEGVSCAGVLLESHVAFHTWPKEGVVALDLFTCGAGLLIPVLPLIKQLFGVPVQDAFRGDGELFEPAMLWSHKLRGFRDGFSPNYDRHENPLEQDLGFYLGGRGFGAKELLVSHETEYQRVDIYEAAPSASDRLRKEAREPDKILFLDGVQQSSLRGDAAYHEALVHPAMIAHPNPKRVAIIGGGEGATLREVLRHHTVTEAVMVEIDEVLVDLCRKYLPEWSDCSDVEGSDADSCFDDSRAKVAFRDAFKWFIDSFGEGVMDALGEGEEGELFDVIIMDALDPDRLATLVGSLYKDNQFVNALFNGLSAQGVLVMQLGEADSSDDPGADMGRYQDVADIKEALQNVGFKSMHIYDEGHSHFSAPWTYLVCFKDSKSRARWYRSSPEIEIELRRRIRRTRSGEPALSFLDAPTATGYQVPARAFQTSYCRSEAAYPWECDYYYGIDPEEAEVPMSYVEARKSGVGEFAGRGLFAKRDIPAYSHLDIGNSVKAIHILPSSWAVIESLHRWAGDNAEYGFEEQELYIIQAFAEGYGYVAILLGTKHITVDSGINNFCNHGCNGTYNYGNEFDEGLTEMNVNLEHFPESLHSNVAYSPIFERHLRQLMTVGDYTLRDIHEGEEILCDYLSFVVDPDNWEREVIRLRNDCSGEEMGEIAEYEFKAGDYERSDSPYYKMQNA